MSLKSLLGLDAFPITEAEIMRRIEDAHHKQLQQIQFSVGKTTVNVILHEVRRESVWRENASIYS